MIVTEGETEIRCGNCHRRLADFENQIRGGHIVIEIKCRKCEKLHRERIEHVTS